MVSVETRNEICWATGIYDNDCECEICEHKNECSGYDHEEDDDKEDN